MTYEWNKKPQTMRTQTIRNARQAAKTKPATSSSVLGQSAGLSPEDIQKIATQVAEAIQAGDYPAELKNLRRNVAPSVAAKLRSKNKAQTLADALANSKKPR